MTVWSISSLFLWKKILHKPYAAIYIAIQLPWIYYRKRGSASYIVCEVLSVRERERERDTDRQRERDGSDVTIVALKSAMNLHFPLPKVRTIGDELTLSLAKNSHFSFLPSHFPSLPSRRGQHCGAETRNEFTLSIAKNFFVWSVNSSPILAWQWWRHFHLSLSVCISLSLSLSPKVPHAQYRKRFRASYNTDRQTERDGSDVTIVALKLAMNLHFPLPKNSHNWRWAYTFPCQKFALFVSPFALPFSPFTERSPLWRWNSQRVHTFHCQKIFRPLCSPSIKWHEPRDEWSKLPPAEDKMMTRLVRNT